MIIGIDAGGSALKLVAMERGEVSFSHYELNGGNSLSELVPGGASRIALTGVGAESCGARELGLPVTHISELEAIGRGGLYLAGRERAVIISIGTGTAFVLADGDKFTHLGGSGIGGGTLFGLGERLFGLRDAALLDELASRGEEHNVDITIGDLFSGSETLDPRLTAANLAKANPEATDADWAAGLVNLILQAIGTMAMLACGGHGIGTVIITGAAAGFSAAEDCYQKFQDMYGIEYLIPPHAEFSTAVGAVLIAEDN